MALQVILQAPDGTQYDLTTGTPGGHYLIGGDETINRRIEDDSGQFTTGDVQLTFANEDGWFDTQWAALDPYAKWDEAAGKGTWCLLLKKSVGGVATVVWDGDLDVPSVERDYKHKTVAATFLGSLKRLEKWPAYLVSRAIPSPLDFTCTKMGRKLTFSGTAASTLLVPGDTIHCGALVLNGQPIDQDLGVHYIGPRSSDTPLLTANQIAIRQGCKKAYTEGFCTTPWQKGLTVSALWSAILSAMGATGTIHTPNASQVVDEANFGLAADGKSMADAVKALCEAYGCIVTRTPSGYCLQGRDQSAGDMPKALDALLLEHTEQPTYDRHYITVLVKGPQGSGANQGRQYRVGFADVYPADELDIQTDLITSISGLKWLAEYNYGLWASARKIKNVTVDDDGTAYQLWKGVTIGGVLYYVIEAEEPIRSVDASCRSSIKLKLLQAVGTTPPELTDNPGDKNQYPDPPLPPEDVELGKGKDNAGDRVSWWSAFRAIFPNDENFPLVKVKVGTQGDTGNKAFSIWRLWAVRWKWPYGGASSPFDSPDGFQVTTFGNGGADTSKDKQHHGITRDLTPDSGGYYYGFFYKPEVLDGSSTPPVWAVVVQAWDEEFGLSAYSDMAYTDDTYDPGDGGDDTAPTNASITGVTFSGETAPGADGPRYDAAVSVQWDGQADKVVVRWKIGTGDWRHTHFAVSSADSSTGNTATVNLPHHFHKGRSVTFAVQVLNVNAGTGWVADASSPRTVDATVAVPTAGTLAFVSGFPKARVSKMLFTAAAADDKTTYRRAELWGYLGSTGTLPSDPPGSGWLLLDDKGIYASAKGGQTSWHFKVVHKESEAWSYAARAININGDNGAFGGSTTSATLQTSGAATDDALPSAATLTSINSLADDIPGTPGKQASADITIGLPGSNQTSVMVRIHDTTGSDYYHEEYELAGTETSLVVHFGKKFDVGDACAVTLIRLYNRTAFVDTTPSSGNTFTAGTGSYGATNNASLAGLECIETKKRRSLFDFGGGGITGTEASLLRHLHIYKAASNVAYPNAAFKKAKSFSIAHKTSGAWTVDLTPEFSAHHAQDATVYIAVVGEDCYGRPTNPSPTVSSGAPADSDDTVPSLPTVTAATSNLHDLAGTARKECDLSLTFSFASCHGIEIEVSDPDGTVTKKIHTKDLTSKVAYWKHNFDKGDTLHYRWKAHNGTAWTAWSTLDASWPASAPSVTAGGGAAPTPGAPTITLDYRTSAVAVFIISYSSQTDIRQVLVQTSEDGSTYVDVEPILVPSTKDAAGSFHVKESLTSPTTKAGKIIYIKAALENSYGVTGAWTTLSPSTTKLSDAQWFMDASTGLLRAVQSILDNGGTGAYTLYSALSALFVQRPDYGNAGIKALVPDLTDAYPMPPFSSESALLTHYASSIPDGQTAFAMDSGNLKMYVYHAGTWYKFAASGTVSGGTGGTGTNPSGGDPGTCFEASTTFTLDGDGNPMLLSDLTLETVLLGVNQETGEETTQAILAIDTHEDAPYDDLGGLHVATHMLCGWISDPTLFCDITVTDGGVRHAETVPSMELALAGTKQADAAPKPPGLSTWIRSDIVPEGCLLWGRTNDDGILCIAAPALSSGAGTATLVALTTELMDYWVSGDGVTFYLAHNRKAV